MSPLLDAEEIAKRLNVSRATAYREMHNMLHVVVGRRAIRVSEAAFEAYLRRRSSSPKFASTTRIRAIEPRTKPESDRGAG
jgi:excisionase family DNA binding protein